ncbi:Uncharacterized protein TCAP_03582 [Tolypocladium capitatum]|uniref:Uncharacterized protein n=1 Tax=Tolypocladium capitatum TaxID=45235 RepID=A0A2K3QG30_9HYPO|nr:Uncharacterized protein TCAP_03582 [Tolypocladium capitatum]
MASIPVRDGRDHKLEAGLLSTLEEETTTFIPARPQESRPKRTMSSIRRLAVAIIVGLFVGMGLAVAKDSAMARCLRAGHGVSNHEVKASLAKDPSPDLVYRLLHAYFPDKYQRGVHEPDNDATKAVHADDPDLAPTMAELAKRQRDGSGSNTTSSEVKLSDPTTIDAHQHQHQPGINVPYPFDKPGAVDDFLATSIFLCLHFFQYVPSRQPFFLLFVVYRSGDAFHDNIPTAVDVDVDTADFRYVGRSYCLVQPTEDGGVHQRCPRAMFQHEELAGSPASETTPTSTPTSTQETITTGKVTTSSAVRKTLTTTLGNGGTTTITSTSWVAVVPSPTTSGSNNAGLQNAASQKRGDVVLAVAVGALIAGVLLT